MAFLLVVWISFGRTDQKSLLAQSEHRTDGTVRNKYWKASVVQQQLDEENSSAEDRGQTLARLSNSSRPFAYIGDLDPAAPQPWPKEEKDWWSFHERLVERVKESDASEPSKVDIDGGSRLPQLIFFGDSITEGWLGTSFGNRPGKHRMWAADEHEQIRGVFSDKFGERSQWGKGALKPPVVLGISGSRTYDFLWRLENGEFPTSQLLHDKGQESEEDDFAKTTFQLDKLERVFIVLMGTNNIGGGMLPEPTVRGLDAVGRAILDLHQRNFPTTPSAMLFSELLPRRDDFRAVRMCPPRCKNATTLEPFKSFTPAIETVNRALPDVVDGWSKDYANSRIVLLSSGMNGPEKASGDEGEEVDAADDLAMTVHCGREMFAIVEEEEFDSYMPDRLHPNARGYELWSRCLLKGLEQVMNPA